MRCSALKCVLRNPVQFPLSKHFSLCRELQHLARQTLLMEHVAGGTAACLCDITIYLLFWILFELGWKDPEKVCRHILTPVFFFLLPPRSNFRHTNWLDIVFYTFACLLGFNQRGRERDTERWGESLQYFPKDMHAEGRKHQSTSWCLTHWIFVDMTRSCQMFWIGGELNDMKHSPGNNS